MNVRDLIPRINATHADTLARANFAETHGTPGRPPAMAVFQGVVDGAATSKAVPLVAVTIKGPGPGGDLDATAEAWASAIIAAAQAHGLSVDANLTVGFVAEHIGITTTPAEIHDGLEREIDAWRDIPGAGPKPIDPRSWSAVIMFAVAHHA